MSQAPVIALAALASSAYGAAPCPANPLLALTGRWTFNVQSVPSGPGPGAQNGQVALQNEFAIAGQFTPTLDPPRAGLPTPTDTGWLRITGTSWINGSPTSLETDAGRYQINRDCSGGSLIMNMSSYPMQYDFWFYNGNQSIYLVSTVNGRSATGSATLAPTGCPVGVQPIQVLTGPYAFKFQGIPWFPTPFGIAGVFTASTDPLFRPGFLDPRGRLDIRATSNLTFGGSVTRLEGDVGSFQVWPDCSGGSLVMNLSSQPMQYDFYFQAGFSQADVISTTGTVIGTRIPSPAYGVFTR